MTKQIHDIPAGSPAERIVEVATDLFFNQGYRATGINEVISKSGVAKATFYSHFKSKDDLCCEYLRGSCQHAMRHINRYIDQAEDPLNRFLAPMRSMLPMMTESDYRGCAFMNIAAEVPDCASPLRQEGINLYNQIGKRLQQLSTELIESDPKKYGALQADALAENYQLILAGAVSLAEIYGDIRPVEKALDTLHGLIGMNG